MFDLTVAICTYNGAARLPEVLACLRSQLTPTAFPWAILVVDNNSTDATAQVVQQHQADWPATPPLFYAFEPQQGMAFARRRAIQQSQSPWIAFLDDDNWPTADWVAQVYDFGCAHPQAGAYGSHLLPHYEAPPPHGFERIAGCLAVIDRGAVPYRYVPQQWRFPAGAGMVVRRQAWVETVPAVPLLTGVCGAGLRAKGEDVESLSYLNRAGWEIWHNPAMQVVHAIPSHRLERDYLIRLFQGIGLSRYPTRMIRFPAWQWPWMIPLFLLNDLRKLFWYGLQRPADRADLVRDCERTLLLYSVVSPFYHGYRSGRQRAKAFKATLEGLNPWKKRVSSETLL